MWKRPDLSPRDNRVKPSAISEIITHLAFYSGWQNAMSAVYDRVMGINLRGVWSCMKFELQQIASKEAAIVSCSSHGGLMGGNQRGTYHAAKHGVIGFTKSAALEYATRGSRVNDLCPGMIQTPMSDKMIAEGQGEELNTMAH